MNRSEKIFVLFIVFFVGFGTSLFHYLTRGDYLSEDLVVKGTVAQVYEINPSEIVALTNKEVDYYPSSIFAFDLITKQGNYTFTPSLRDINKEDPGKEKMTLFFQKLLTTKDTLKIFGNEATYYSDIGLLTRKNIFYVDKILNNQKEELYFFPFNPRYDEKIRKTTVSFILTTIFVFIFSLSIAFRWKRKVIE